MRYDVFVAGAGPAGAALSHFLARKGVRVFCADKARFPRQKVCGEFISPEARRTLAALALEDALREAAPITGYRLTGPHGRQWEGEFPPLPDAQGPALGLSRLRLDALLLSAARTVGAEVEEGFTVTAVQGRPGAWKAAGRTRGSPRPVQVEADWLVAADGQHSTLRRHFLGKRPPGKPRRTPLFGFEAHFRDLPFEGRVELTFFPGGYAGVNPVEAGGTNVCFLMRGDALGPLPRSDADLDAVVALLCRRHPALGERLTGGARSTPWTRTGGLWFGRRRCCLRGALFVGDAAGAMDPFAGDGIAMALRGAEILASSLASGAEDSGRRVFRDYPAAWSAEFGRRMRWAAGLRALLRFPAVAEALLSPFSKDPRLIRRIVRATRIPIPPSGSRAERAPGP